MIKIKSLSVLDREAFYILATFGSYDIILHVAVECYFNIIKQENGLGTPYEVNYAI